MNQRVAFPQFVGPSYASTTFIDAEQAMNIYPETVARAAKGKSRVAYKHTPGHEIFVTLPLAPIRGCYVVPSASDAGTTVPNRTFFMSGPLADTHLFEIDFTTNPASVVDVGDIGGIGPDPYVPYQMVFGGGAVSAEAMLIGGESSFTSAIAISMGPVATLFGIPAFPDFYPGATSLAFLDGYYIAASFEDNLFYISALNDPFTWDILDFATLSDQPGNIVGVAVDHRRVLFFGNNQISAYYNSGNNDFPFSRDQNFVVPTGLWARESLRAADNTWFWLGMDANGANVAYRLNGITAQRVSTYAEEKRWEGYATTKDAVGFSYQLDGHSFYCLAFPTEGAMDVYDIGEDMWHERAKWDAATAEYVASLGKYHAFVPAQKLHLVGGGDDTGNVYRMDNGIYQDNGGIIRRVRRSPYLNETNYELFFNCFLVDMETGTVQLFDDQGVEREAIVMVRYSDDNAKTWSNEIAVEAGMLGQYAKRVITYDVQHRARQCCFEMVYVEPTPLIITNAYLEIEQGTN